MMTKKTVVLPVHMKQQAEHFGQIHAELSGHPDDSPEFKEAFKNGFYRFCHEAYTHSMTPSGSLGSNPTTPRISKKNYDVMLDWVEPLGTQKGLTKKQIADVKIQLRTAITIIAHQYLILMTSIRVKRKGGQPSSMEYLAPQGGESEYESLQRNYLVEKRRYVRVFVASMVSAFLELLFKLSELEMGTKLVNRFISPFFSSAIGDEDPRTIGKKLKQLKEPAFRAEFINEVKDDVIKVITSSKKKFKLMKVTDYWNKK